MLFFYLKDVYNRQKMIINKGISQERKILGSKFFHQSIYRIKLHKKQTANCIKFKKSNLDLISLFFGSQYFENEKSHPQNSFINEFTTSENIEKQSISAFATSLSTRKKCMGKDWKNHFIRFN